MDIGSLTGSIELEDQLSRGLQVAAGNVERFSRGFDGMAKTVVVSAGAAAAAITGIGAAIIGLGNRGSDINDVRQTLDQFAGSAENAQAIMQSMRQGVQNTVTDFELAGSAAKLLQANVNLSADGFKTLTEAAFVLQNRGLGGTKEMLDLVSQALITGNTRMLARKLGVIEVKDAEADFARSLGTTKDQLSQAGLAEARRIAIMKMMADAVKNAGVQERDFGELLQAGVVWVRNFGDELASRVAKSQAVIGAVKAIGKAFMDAFGGSTEEALKTIVGWIDKFANAVTKYGPIVIGWIKGVIDIVKQYAPVVIQWISYIIEQVQNFVNRVLQYWETVPDWFKKIAKEAVVAGGVLYLTAKGVESAADLMSKSIGGVANSGLGFADVATSISGLKDSIELSGKAFDKWGGSLTHAAKVASTFFGVIAIDVKKFGLINVVANEFATYISGPFIGAIKAAGGALSTLFLNPIGLTVLAISGLVLALRYLTGSWEFLLKPMRDTWEVLTDIGTIVYDLGKQFVDFAKDAIGGTLDMFKGLGNYLMQEFVGTLNYLNGLLKRLGIDVEDYAKSAIDMIKGIATASKEAKPIDFMVLIPPGARKGMEEFKDYVHDWAEDIRNAQAEAGWERVEGRFKGVTVPDVTKLPGATGIVPTGALVAPPAPSKRESPNFLKESNEAEIYMQKVRELALSFKRAGDESRAFADVFKTLSAAQLQNLAVQEKLVPMIHAYADAHEGQLSPAMKQAMLDAQATRLAILAQDEATLKAKNITLEFLEEQERLGIEQREVAHTIGVTTDGLARYRTRLEQAAAGQQRVAATAQEMADEIRGVGKKIDETGDMLGDVIEEYEDLVRRETMTATEYQIDQIRRTAREQIQAYENLKGDATEYSKYIERLSEARIRALMRDNETLKRNSIYALQEQATIAQNTYEIMARDVETYGRRAVEAQRKIAEEAKRQADITRSTWELAWDGLKKVIGDFVDEFSDLLSQALTGGGDLLSAAKAFGVKLAKALLQPIIDDAKIVWRDMIKMSGKLATLKQAGALAVGAGVAGVVGAQVDNTAATIGTLAGTIGGLAAQTGVFGASIAGMTASAAGLAAATAGIGLAAVGVYLAYKKWFTVSAEVKKMREEILKVEDALHATLTEQQKIEAGNERWKMTVIAVRDAYVLVGKSVAEAQEDVKAMWDTGNPQRSAAAASRILENVQISENIKAVRGLVQEYLGAGQTIPAALQAKIDKLVIMKKLTAENATELLKLTKEAVPAYADVTAAAERYGIQVAALGPAVQGLRLTEVAQQVIADWELFSKAGADMTVVMDGMQDEVQQLILDSIKFGTALPKQLEPIIKKFIESGRLVDEFGNALTDTAKLTFAETLVEKIEKLVDAMLAFTDAINGSATALGNLAGTPMPRPPTYDTNNPRVGQPGPGGGELSPYQLPDPSGIELPYAEPTYYAGGSTRSNVIAFTPRGTDTEPAMIGPDEEVLNSMESRAYREDRGSGGTAIIEIDGERMAEIVIPKFRRVVKRYGLARRA